MTARAWALDAACAQSDPELWFPEQGGGGAKAARAICDTCTARTQCLEWAIANDEPHGIWGGLTYKERALLRRSRGIPDRNVRIARERAAWVRAALAWGVEPADAAEALGIDVSTVTNYVNAAITGEGAGA